jgi:cytochrome c-type biogenesis protein CcmH/NrfG
MNSDNKRDKDNSNKAAKAISAIPIAGIVVAVTLMLSGVSISGSYHSVFAQQQNMTQEGGNATGAAVGNQAEVMMHLEEVRTALQNNDVQGAMIHLDLAMNLLGSGGTQGNMTSTAGSTNSTG